MRTARRILLLLVLTRAMAGCGESASPVLNVLNDTAEESVVLENLFRPNFGLANTFVDPRRAMVGLRVNFGR